MSQMNSARPSKTSSRKGGRIGRGYRTSRNLLHSHPTPSLPEGNTSPPKLPEWLSFIIREVVKSVVSSLIELACESLVNASTFQFSLSALEHLGVAAQSMSQLPFIIRMCIIIWNILKTAMKK